MSTDFGNLDKLLPMIQQTLGPRVFWGLLILIALGLAAIAVRLIRSEVIEIFHLLTHAWAKLKTKQPTEKSQSEITPPVGVSLNAFHEAWFEMVQKLSEHPPLDGQHLLADWVHKVHDYLKRTCPAEVSLFMGDFPTLEAKWEQREDEETLRQIDEMIWSDSKQRDEYRKSLCVIADEKRLKFEDIMRRHD